MAVVFAVVITGYVGDYQPGKLLSGNEADAFLATKPDPQHYNKIQMEQPPAGKAAPVADKKAE